MNKIPRLIKIVYFDGEIHEYSDEVKKITYKGRIVTKPGGLGGHGGKKLERVLRCDFTPMGGGHGKELSWVMFCFDTNEKLARRLFERRLEKVLNKIKCKEMTKNTFTFTLDTSHVKRGN